MLVKEGHDLKPDEAGEVTKAVVNTETCDSLFGPINVTETTEI